MMWQDEHVPPWDDDNAKKHLLNSEGNPATEEEWQEMYEQSVLKENNMQFLAGQRAAFERVVLIAEAFYEGLWHDWVIKPRLMPLVVAPSGHGKNWLIQGLAKKLDMEGAYLRVSPSSWIPQGAKVSSSTLSVIHKLILNSKQRRCILHVDELDKFGDIRQEWSRCCCEELFAVLDKDTNHHYIRSWKNEDRRAFQKSMFIIGSGTWQELWNQSQTSVGFGPEKDAVDKNYFAAQKEIPQELLYRFCNDLVLIPPWKAEDLAEMVEICGSNLPNGVVELIESQSEEIISSRRGVRFIEDLIAIWLVLERAKALENPENKKTI